MMFLKRPILPAEGERAQSGHLREVADEAGVPFNPHSIVYIPVGGAGDWVGFRDAPNPPDPAKDAIDDVFSRKWEVDVRFATQAENEQLTAFYEADPENRPPKSELPR